MMGMGSKTYPLHLTGVSFNTAIALNHKSSDLGHIFCGESMFSKIPNASKVAFIHLAKQLEQQNYRILDCQIYNDHLASLGCVEINRDDFMLALKL
jgi:leucyl/phenylalanyl-tRNA--protein transferase